MKWKPKLVDTQISNYIISQSVETVDEEMLEELFHDSEGNDPAIARLETVETSKIRQLNKDSNKISKRKLKEYLDKDNKNQPPIVVDKNYEIVDGYHRYKVTRQLNIKTIQVYRLNFSF